MLYILILFILIGLVSVATVYVVDEPGYVLLQWGVWQVELSLVLGIVLIALAVLLLFIGLEVLSGIVRVPGRLGRSYRGYREQRKYAASIRGLQQLLLGNWAKAEQLLDSSVNYLPQPVISYLAAAFAAQRQGKTLRRNHYLAQARQLDASMQELVALITSRLQMDNGEYAEAIDELKKLCAKLPKNSQAFGLLAEAYEVNEDWEALEQLLPHLQKLQIYPSAEFTERAGRIMRHRLQAAQQPTELQKIWKRTHSSVQKRPEVITTYVQRLLASNCHLEAEKIIRHALDRHWNSELAYLYGMIDGHVNDRRLYDTAAKWIDRHPQDANLLLTVGRLARRVGLTELAKTRLEKSIELGARPAAYEELGQLLEEQHANEQALRVYRAGLAGTGLPQENLLQAPDADGYSASDENSKES